uniref:Haloacid dehalogenase-like hydrolase domain-containing 5 n=1 Tax=Eptatretus burgeri TaxID=7764 RepID=A0A8C4PZ85_EPTBU
MDVLAMHLGQLVRVMARPAGTRLARLASGSFRRHSWCPVRHMGSSPTFGLLFDIDGVLIRGKTPIPAAREAFTKLVDSKGEFLIPVVFVTNAGNCLRQTKADQLSQILEVPISQDQVMMSHSPLRMFQQFHDKHVLVSGQGPVEGIAKNLGFSDIVTIDMVREAFPLLDMVDHNRRPKQMVKPPVDFPKIEAVILFGEPIRWETNLQLVVDVLLTNGSLGSPSGPAPYPHLPVLACNMDLMWMAEARRPRFGHGTFMVCLESIYKKVTGKELIYEVLMGKPSEITYHHAEYLLRKQAEYLGWTVPVRTIYAIGDNPMADIYGANLYDRFLASHRQRKSVKSSQLQAQAAGGGGNSRATHLVPRDSSFEDGSPTALSTEVRGVMADTCRSILVCTGVYSPRAKVPADPKESISEMVFHGHRDFKFEPELVLPQHTASDVNAAVDVIFKEQDYRQC